MKRNVRGSGIDGIWDGLVWVNVKRKVFVDQKYGLGWRGGVGVGQRVQSEESISCFRGLEVFIREELVGYGNGQRIIVGTDSYLESVLGQLGQKLVFFWFDKKVCVNQGCYMEIVGFILV